MEAGEGQPPQCFNTNADTNIYNYPLESPMLPPAHHQPPEMDIDWVSLLNGASATVEPASPASSSVPAAAGKESRTTRTAKKGGGGPPRVAFHTRSGEDVLDDGFKWRKYGQKSVKNSLHPRSYYRCTYHTCNVKKQIQRLSRDTSVVVTTYEGVHNHPTEKLMETLAPLLKQLHFLRRF